MKHNFSLEYLVSEIFNRWTCDKVRASVIVMYEAHRYNALDRVYCVRAVNPFTHDVRFMKADSNGDIRKAGLAWLRYTDETDYFVMHQVFKKIVTDVFTDTFGFACKIVDDEQAGTCTGTVTIQRYRQFMEFINKHRHDIEESCRKGTLDEFGYEMDGFFDRDIWISVDTDIDAWFNEFISPTADPVSYTISESVSSTVKGDMMKYVIDVNDPDWCGIPELYNNMFEILSRFLWTFIKPDAVKYSDYFKVYPVSEDDEFPYGRYFDYIEKRCVDFNMLKAAVVNGADKCENCSGLTGHLPSDFKKYAKYFIRDCRSLKTGLKIVKYWDERIQSIILKEIADLLEYYP